MRHVYLLVDPTDGRVRYIGCTKKNTKDRLTQHITKAKEAASPKSKELWILGLLKVGLKPITVTLFSGDYETAVEIEKSAIAANRLFIYNKVRGGGGTRDRDPSVGAKLSKAFTGKPVKKKWVPIVRSDGTIFESVNSAAVQCGIKRRSISNVLNGWSKSAGGFSWGYSGV